ncbi:hypothetical protein GIB67_026476 [Kingdonia uniflora]|uniref:DNA-directed RNA polymerase n=1 Tax=Kingdonia uniflora TaxID=39325 RepID=A0A7J7P724_9MAGN|nr:hypothetical protein GIB67_026476 [Kingdonia uniflora]
MTEKGEVALEILLEKASVKKSGDAWRIVMDSCLSIMHLIDTRRSVPYAIKQVQESLGISSAFDQAIQHLSTSIKSIKKDVLKEYLVLIANSITCTGNFLGFNSACYKALFRSLAVPVPFTEATLSCFEKAAEKCHLDSLSSTVASYSWGKHVAVGTGSRFELLWNTKEMGLEQEAGLDVYAFLELVSNEGESNAYLYEGFDDLEDVEDMELSLSPVNQDACSLGWGSSSGGRENENEVQSPWSQPKKSPSVPHPWDLSGGADRTENLVESHLGQPKETPSSGWGSSSGWDVIENQVKSQYNDGDQLSSDDQSFVLDNVLNYYPDKAAKMGNGVDYIMAVALLSGLNLGIEKSRAMAAGHGNTSPEDAITTPTHLNTFANINQNYSGERVQTLSNATGRGAQDVESQNDEVHTGIGEGHQLELMPIIELYEKTVGNKTSEEGKYVINYFLQTRFAKNREEKKLVEDWIKRKNQQPLAIRSNHHSTFNEHKRREDVIDDEMGEDDSTQLSVTEIMRLENVADGVAQVNDEPNPAQQEIKEAKYTLQQLQ